MPQGLSVQVRCFASVRDLLGCERLDVPLAVGSTVAALREELSRRAPGLASLRVAYAVNRAYVREDHVLQQGDEVALIPPISGGSRNADRFRLDFVRGAIDARALEAEARTDRDGAVCTFTGTTRDHNEGASVQHLEYEAYAEMAQTVMARIAEETFAAHAITRIRVAHRLGVVPIGEASVVVVVSSEHRGPAFDACRSVMDRLKKEAPIWKRERLSDGQGERWIGELPQP